MIDRLSKRDKRALVIGGICAAAIIFIFVLKIPERWAQARKSLASVRAKLKAIDAEQAKRAGLMSIVPAFEMPQVEEKQTFLFRDKLNEQLKKAGVNSKPLQVLPVAKARQSGYKLLRLKCSGKCNFEQALDLLAGLNENPYLVGIEEFKIKCDPKNRQAVELDFTVSTFVK
jgi:hypothetical protein